MYPREERSENVFLVVGSCNKNIVINLFHNKCIVSSHIRYRFMLIR